MSHERGVSLQVTILSRLMNTVFRCGGEISLLNFGVVGRNVWRGRSYRGS